MRLVFWPIERVDEERLAGTGALARGRLGPQKPSITLDIYAREIEQRNHADGATETIATAFGGILG